MLRKEDHSDDFFLFGWINLLGSNSWGCENYLETTKGDADESVDSLGVNQAIMHFQDTLQLPDMASLEYLQEFPTKIKNSQNFDICYCFHF